MDRKSAGRALTAGALLLATAGGLWQLNDASSVRLDPAGTLSAGEVTQATGAAAAVGPARSNGSQSVTAAANELVDLHADLPGHVVLPTGYEPPVLQTSTARGWRPASTSISFAVLSAVVFRVRAGEAGRRVYRVRWADGPPPPGPREWAVTNEVTIVTVP